MSTTCPTCAQPMPEPPPKPSLIRMDGKYTRRGRPILLYCIDSPGEYPVHGRDEQGLIYTFTATGQSSAYKAHPEVDLIEVAPPAPAKWKVERTMILYRDGTTIWAPVGSENRYDKEGRIACVHITLSGVEGQGIGAGT